MRDVLPSGIIMNHKAIVILIASLFISSVLGIRGIIGLAIASVPLLLIYKSILDHKRIQIVRGSSAWNVVFSFVVLAVPLAVILLPGVILLIGVHFGAVWCIDRVDSFVANYAKEIASISGPWYSPSAVFGKLYAMLVTPVSVFVHIACWFCTLLLEIAAVLLCLWVSFSFCRAYMTLFSRCAIRWGWNARFSLGQ